MTVDAATAYELERLVLMSFYAVDRSERSFAPPHTDDFTLSLPNMTMTADQYETFLDRRMTADYATRHCVTNVLVTSATADAATVVSVAIVHRLEAGATETSVDVVDYEDEWVRVDGAWLQKARRIIPTLKMRAMEAAGAE
jgi:hypothetical protein